MTIDPRARAIEIARNALERISLYPPSPAEIDMVADRMLQFAREVLTQDTDDDIVNAGREASGLDSYRTIKSWIAMSAHLAARLEEK